MFSLKIKTVYNIIFRAEKEWRLDLKGSTGKPKMVMQRVERKIIKTVYDSPQSSTIGLALQVEKALGLRVSHATTRNVLEKHKYSSRVARKKPMLSAQSVEKRLRFTSFGVLEWCYFLRWVENIALLSWRSAKSLAQASDSSRK